MDAHLRLGRNAKAILDDPNVHLILPAIVLAEALFILEVRPQRHKIGINDLLRRLEADPRIDFANATHALVLKTLDCTAIPEMHDRQIIATALLAQSLGAQVVVLTKDQLIRTSGLVATLW
jgi:hypothetical protein